MLRGHRLRALVRRSADPGATPVGSNTTQIGAIRYDKDSGALYLNGEVMELTPRELALMLLELRLEPLESRFAPARVVFAAAGGTVVVVVEVVFGYNALGQYLVDHVTKRDVPVVQAVGLIFAAVYIFLNMAADIIAIVANPRLRHPK